ncbi:MAG: hypothetical protein V4590_04760 [Bacteroidota bacterium]
MSEVLQVTDYNRIGVPMKGGVFSSTKVRYRFGYSGQERDDEIYGEGNMYTADYWEYDARLGRRWNCDLIYLNYESPYVVNHNNPNYFVDPDGATPRHKGPYDKTRVGNFLSRLWHTVTHPFSGWDNSFYSRKHARDPGSSGSWLKKIVQPVANLFRRLFTGQKYNLSTIPAGKWVISEWQRLKDLDLNPDDGIHYYNIPNVGDKLWATRIRGDRQEHSNITRVTLTGLVGEHEIPMSSTVIITPNPYDWSTDFQITSGILKRIGTALSVYSIANLSAKTPFIQLLVTGMSLSDATSPIYRKATKFVLTTQSFGPVKDISLDIKTKYWQPIDPTTRSSLFRWYHGIN